MKPSPKSAISRINKQGILLVFPVNNRKEPKSLWSEFHPRKKMRWEWDNGGDTSVHDMWHLMKRLSDDGDVVYTKWFRGRATFISRELFTAMLRLRRPHEAPVGPTARAILDVLETDSPISTRDVKKQTELQGRLNEPTYGRAMKELFEKLLIVGYGEVDDGAFPSLAVGATRSLYEDLWAAGEALALAEARRILDTHMPEGSAFRRFFDKNAAITSATSSVSEIQ